MNGASTLQLWDRYHNIFIRRRMAREASRMSPGVCGARGLASGLMSVLNSDELGYRLEEVVLTGLRIVERQKPQEDLHSKLQGTHGTTLGNHGGLLLPLDFQLLFDVSGTLGESRTYLPPCRERNEWPRFPALPVSDVSFLKKHHWLPLFAQVSYSSVHILRRHWYLLSTDAVNCFRAVCQSVTCSSYPDLVEDRVPVRLEEAWNPVEQHRLQST